MKEKMYKFMSGRNGPNAFSRFLSVLSLIAIIASFFFDNIVRQILFWFGFLLIVYSNYIVFSKNIAKRSIENQDFLRLKNKFTGRFSKLKMIFKQRKEYKFFKCENCKTTLRVPKGKGKIKVHCKKCGHDMIKKS
ncbi:hypothetical protein [Miniphocaeibacter halophilus]|uniref:Uncharacterized protein n=1 Tax=Miniphocaeibacter halophilus TaxID=2931922 RepID=A0AC61MP37_9FIRM|nr:hypothetical protein [Miniphocaeibacter halophilus]QQK07285.1 hypothetical protein JFY71_08140 [Miniphocaeibacter halophilus]